MSEISPPLPQKETVIKEIHIPVRDSEKEKLEREAERREAENMQKQSLDQIRNHISAELSQMKKSLENDQVFRFDQRLIFSVQGDENA